ncbi:YegP family protein [Arsenophonus endosymbiont of Bemisia tabaci]|uniref:YegP family protein n=1 Tax=Arsenophonus endosymbiont of Bemisia tabaci TaxID=536059 RepID=UPI0015F389CF|nr:YegP family protein [Arsenophonus endosymbiont of Bemisia tabaci]CAA2929105.1 hypothetical protein ARSQ2_00170 [Arsenophonus endosymbiont of Bemisia tabaci Q2]
MQKKERSDATQIFFSRLIWCIKIKSLSYTEQPYYFVLKGANHKVIATSEMYKTKAAVQKGIASVQKNGPTKQVKDLTSES